MAGIRRKRLRDLRAPIFRYRRAVTAALVLLALGLIFTGFTLNANARRQLDDVRNHLAKMIQSDLNQVSAAYANIDLRSADVEGTILPTMAQSMYAAESLNRALVGLFGEAYRMLDAQVYEQFLQAIQEYERLSGIGQSTSGARELLDASMTALIDSQVSRFDAKGNLIPSE